MWGTMRSWMSPRPSAQPKCQACHTKRTATQNGSRCHQVPRLPRKVPRRLGGQSRPSAPPEPAQCYECHACPAKATSMLASASLPHKRHAGVTRGHACHAKCCGAPGDQSRRSVPPESPEPAQCHNCCTCDAKEMPMRGNATPAAAQKIRRCQPDPCLPCKVPRRLVCDNVVSQRVVRERLLCDRVV